MNSLNKELVSVITVCFNCKHDIEATLQSILGQNHISFEYIIVDGGSTDGTMEIIEKYRDKIDVLISEPDKGIFDAMNKGLNRASGTWVNFMNAGDTFYDLGTLSKVFENETYPGVGVVFGSKVTNGEILHPAKLSSLKYGGIMACHQSIFYNCEICGNELYYKTKYQHYGDIELTRRLYLKKIPFQQVDVVISDYKGSGFSSIVSSVARKAKFGYLYENLGIMGLCYGIIGKIKYLLHKSIIK
jgi:glycosyltransferase involved in cell wall biosynthesis